jgi:hypothetical protein
MADYLHAGSDGAEEIARALGLPDDVLSVEFTLRAGEMAQLNLERFVTDECGKDFARVLKKYRLVEITAETAGVS